MKKYTVEYWVEWHDCADNRYIEVLAISPTQAIKKAKQQVVGRKFKIIKHDRTK